MLAIYVAACSSPFSLWVLEVEDSTPEAFWEAWQKAADENEGTYASPENGEVSFVEGTFVEQLDVGSQT